MVRERLAGLRRRVEDAARELRGLFAELTADLAATKVRLESRERTAHAARATAAAPIDAGCIVYCRKVLAVGRGDVYLRLTASHVVFHAVRTSGALFWKSQALGPPELVPLTGSISLTDLRQPLLGHHTVTLRQGGPAGPGLDIWAGREAIDDLVAVASGL